MAAAAQPAPHALNGAGGDAPGSPLQITQWARVDALPCVLSVEISMPSFTVGDLVRLAPGSLIASRWTVGQDVPLRVNGELIAWSEFEVVQNRLAVRLTELA
jgi:flagellar motor switch/type III secretory pathway protein FliN